MDDRSLRFYLDEHMPVAIAAQLNRKGIDTKTARELRLQGRSDTYDVQMLDEFVDESVSEDV